MNKIAANAGATKSQGVEVTLNTTNISTRNFTWNSTLTLAHYNDRWDKRPVDWKPNSYEKKDDPIRAWWAYESEGILQVGEKAPAAQADLLPGQVKIKDQNKDGVINDNDKIYMDNGDPKLTFGFNNSLRYKNLDFTIISMGKPGVNVARLIWKTGHRLLKERMFLRMYIIHLAVRILRLPIPLSCIVLMVMVTFM